jgi:hypothetical protein
MHFAEAIIYLQPSSVNFSLIRFLAVFGMALEIADEN